MQQPRIKAFIIHLERATERREQVAALMSQLPVPAEIITAVDAKQLSDKEVDQVYKRRLHKPAYPFRLSRNEIACFLSHRKTWQAIIDQNLDAALVLEDDVALTTDFPAAFAAARAVLKQNSFIRLPFRPKKEQGTLVQSIGDVQIIKPCPVGLGTIGQLVSREAAQKLLDITTSFDRPVDTFEQMNWITSLQPLAVIPGGVDEISAVLGGSTLKQKRNLLHKLHREIMRPFYRRSVIAYSRRNRKAQ